jgi:ribonuclease D
VSQPSANPPTPSADDDRSAAAAPAALPLLVLSEPMPALVDTPSGLDRVIGAFSAGHGPVAIDAERASGYRYSQRAYLVQLRRRGAGTALVDPIAFATLEPLADVLVDEEWILHAATQDLACLREVGLVPTRLFDTELAGRLLNLPRVGLATLVEELLGSRLAKEHSAVDWSTRPLPAPWLEYAALDVEVLVELRDLLAARLEAAGKAEWAAEEFAALVHFAGPEPRAEPWRRTSGIHRLRGRRALAVVRELWQARNQLAADLDIAPGRLLTDAAIVEAAAAPPVSAGATRTLPGMRHRQARKHVDRWYAAIERGLAVEDTALPTISGRGSGLPPPRSWPERNPPAAARLSACREVLAAVSADVDVPAENLLTPESVRRLAWAPPDPIDADTVATALQALGARSWQIGLVQAGFTSALQAQATAPTSAE